ncbi:hypothetical protein ACX9R5_06585 [Rathayibacter sp. CAU 1779]
MADLKISDDVLDQLKSGLKSIADQLHSSSSFADEIGELVGDSDLAGKVHSFSSKWSTHRTKMIDGVTQIHDETATIDDKFGELDGQLTQALTTKHDGKK